MFTRKVTDDEAFFALSSSAQALYLHLSMSADDDGFCNQVSVAMFRAHASVQDLQSLMEKRFVYQFENGVIVILHWRMANALRKDRYTKTTFLAELEQLHLDEKTGAYDMVAKRLPDGCHVVAELAPQDRIGKDSIGYKRESTLTGTKEKSAQRFAPPTIEEVNAYAQEIEATPAQAERFRDYYESKGWKVGRSSMVNWKAAFRNWVRKDKEDARQHQLPQESSPLDEFFENWEEHR
jgi:hypothetical protein